MAPPLPAHHNRYCRPLVRGYLPYQLFHHRPIVVPSPHFLNYNLLPSNIHPDWLRHPIHSYGSPVPLYHL